MAQGAGSERLDGHVALVVGGTGRIGRAACAELARRGAHVAVGYRSSRVAAGEMAAALHGTSVRIDSDDDGSIDAAFSVIEAGPGPVSVLVDTAHPEAATVAFADADRSSLAAQFAGVQGYAAVCRRAIPAMREQSFGRIVYVSGALMSRPAPALSAYGAAKAAASTLTRYLALEEGRAGITANIVAPGRVFDPEEDLDDVHRKLSDRLLERTALGRFPTAGDVASVIGVLATSAHLTAQTLWVTGGEPIIA